MAHGSDRSPRLRTADSHPVTADADTIEVKIDDPDWSALVSAALLGTERTGGTAPIPTAVAGLVAGADTEQAILAAAASMAVRRRAGRTTSLDQAPLPLPAEPDPRPQLAGPPARYVGLAFEERPSLAPEVLELVRRDRSTPARRVAPGPHGTGGAHGPTTRTPLSLTWAEPVPHGSLAAFRTWPVMPGGGSGRTGRKPGRQPPAAQRGQRSFAGFASWTCPAPDNSWRTTGRRSRPRNELASSRPSRRASTRPTRPSSPSDSRIGGRTSGAPPRASWSCSRNSALTRRLEDEARPLLATGGLVRKSLKVSLPTTSEEFEALGFTGRPASGYGERAWLLRSILAHVRPERWTEWLQVDASGLVDQATRSDEARPLIEGWMEATARFGDPVWAAAILRNKDVPTKVSANVGQVLDRLSPGERALAVADSAAVLDPSLLAGLAAAVPAPWPKALGDAVLSAARSAGREQYPGADLYELVRAAALRLPPDRADELEAVASFKDELRPALTDAIETIRLRARIHEAFAAVPPLTA